MESVWITRQLCWHEGADSGLASDPAECETNELMDGRCGSLDIPGGSHIQAHLGGAVSWQIIETQPLTHSCSREGCSCLQDKLPSQRIKNSNVFDTLKVSINNVKKAVEGPLLLLALFKIRPLLVKPQQQLNIYK